MSNRRTLLVLAALMLCTLPQAHDSVLAKDKKADAKAAKKQAQEAAFAALRRGEILPLSQILEIATREVPGNIIEIEFKGGPVYEVEILTPSGQIKKLRLDARTGQLLRVEGK